MSDTAKRSERLLRGGGIISAGTMTTRLLGLLRELMTAAYFGAGGAVDAFVVAFSVPGLFRRVLGEEMFERAFMPPFRRMADSGEGGHARAFLARIFLLVVLALVLVSAHLKQADLTFNTGLELEGRGGDAIGLAGVPLVLSAGTPITSGLSIFGETATRIQGGLRDWIFDAGARLRVTSILLVDAGVGWSQEYAAPFVQLGLTANLGTVGG